MKWMFLIKRKGFNYYTDYTELYLHRTFENHGFYLVKDKEKSVFHTTVYIPESEKYMTLISPFADSFSRDEAETFLKDLSVSFKSEVLLMPYDGKFGFNGTPYNFWFSDIDNAFLEEPFLSSGGGSLERETFSLLKNGEPYVAEFINYGGAFKGLTITVILEENTELYDTTINFYKEKEKLSQNISFEKSGNQFVCRLPEFEMSEGMNKYSAVLRGKKKEEEKIKHSFYIRFIPEVHSGKNIFPKIDIEIDHWKQC